MSLGVAAITEMALSSVPSGLSATRTLLAVGVTSRLHLQPGYECKRLFAATIHTGILSIRLRL